MERFLWLKRLCWFLAAFLLSLSLHWPPSPTHAQLSTVVPASTIAPASLVQQGREYYQAGQYSQAIAPLQAASDTYNTLNAPLNQALTLSYLALVYQELGDRPQSQSALDASIGLLPTSPDSESAYQVQAQVLNTQGELQFAWGQLEAAVAAWQSAAIAYRALDDQAGLMGTQINQIQALRALGYYRQANHRIEALDDQLTTLPPSDLALTAWRSLGNTQAAMGQYESARAALDTSLSLALSLHSAPDAATLLSLGNLERLLGDRQLNQQLLATRQSLVTQSYCPDWSERDLTDTVRRHYQQATDYYQQAVQQVAQHDSGGLQTAQHRLLEIKSRLNHLSLAIALGQPLSIDDRMAIEQRLGELPLSRFTFYANVRFAQDLACLSSVAQDMGDRSEQPSLRRFNRAIQMAQALKDYRAESFAWGSLGHYLEVKSPEGQSLAVKYRTASQYGSNGQIGDHRISSPLRDPHPDPNAKTVTERAMQLAQELQAPDLAYLWQWQMGRLLKADGHREEAIAYYTAAFNTLKGLRSDLTVLDTDIQFSFRESIEPLYRQFTDLLLSPTDSSESQPQSQSQANLRKARDVLEALQLAELDNFFQDACSNIQTESLDAIIEQQGQTTAVLYSIILPDRLDVVLKLPQSESQTSEDSTHRSTEGTLKHYSTPASSQHVRETALDFRRKLTQPHTVKSVKVPAQQLYQWLVQPLETELRAHGIEQIVFVLDGVLRNVSMSALYDGEQYLVERYAVSLSPGLQLLETASSPRQLPSILAAGLSESRSGFPPLPNVQQELEAIASAVPSAIRLLNQEFTEAEIEAKIDRKPISIVHLATHGRFSSRAENTFILTHDGKIDVNDLHELLRGQNNQRLDQAIELLVLSACQTASGDERAALGLAGVAVRAGARSTLASLWSVDDQATALLIAEFYRHLPNQNISKTKALQLAQQSVKNFEVQGSYPYRHPRYWSPFVLLGNWL
ncbi:MAG: CHAT domain-containing protein [Cyanobacteria bacterium P01_F01_bin.150]